MPGRQHARIFARISRAAARALDRMDARHHLAFATGVAEIDQVSIMPSSSAKAKQSPDGMSSHWVEVFSTAPANNAGMAQHD